MARKFTVLDLPGDGKGLRISHDQEELIRELHKELMKLARNPTQGRRLPKNKKSTIRRKGSDTPLRDTGKLLDDILVEESDGAIKVSVQQYYFYLHKPYRQLFRTKDVMEIVDKVAKRYLKKMVRLV